jgi:hypothetical protein
MSLRIRQIVFAAEAREPSATQFGSAYTGRPGLRVACPRPVAVGHRIAGILYVSPRPMQVNAVAVPVGDTDRWRRAADR